ncbi:MAG: ABC transporter substrate-binding protein [Clostridiales bacterium]|nr:ABC transporter substrate-binding protein [Clostridiales bacterium]
MKRIAYILLMLAISLPLISCQVPADIEDDMIENAAFPITIDGVIIENSPKSVISLSPAITEIIFEMGYEDTLIGRSRYCDFPPEVEEIQSVGSGANPDIDSIVDLAPNVVICGSALAQKDTAYLNDKNINVVVIPIAKTINQFYKGYEIIGTLFEGAIKGVNKGQETYEALKSRIDAEINKHSSDRKTFAYITTSSNTIATGDTFEDAILTIFGDNIAADASNYQYSLKDVDKANPDVIYIHKSIDEDKISKKKELANTTAVKNGNIIKIDNIYFERPSLRILELIEQLSPSEQEDAQSKEEESTDTGDENTPPANGD